jgi:predicted phosphodiesterase
MKTAIISDLHLGNLVASDLVRDPEICVTLLDELSGADRVVLLGDVLELRDRPAGEIVERSAPFLELLGTAVGNEGEIIYVPGNHDHRLAESVLDRRTLGPPAHLDLEQRFEPTTDLAAQLAELTRPARFNLAYPGLWLRDDVYAIHGHYLDCHMAIPTIECLSAAVTMRMVGAIPDPADVDDYERAVGPIYGFSWGFAQSRGPERIGGRARPTATAFRRLSSGRSKAGARLLGSVAFPLAARGVGRALQRHFDTDISPQNISRAGLAAIREALRRLRVDAEHVIFGHTHRPGPLEGDDGSAWQLASGARLHATGCWNWSPGLCGPTPEQSLYWPGTVTWVEETGPPRRTELLHDRSRRDLYEIAQRVAASS